MRPWIRKGDTLFIQPVGWQNIRPGNIVVYKNQKGSWIARRVIRKNKNALLIKTDAYLHYKINETIPKNEIIGRVEFVKKSNGEILNMYKTQFVYYIIRYVVPIW